jgi:hypothetical protein
MTRTSITCSDPRISALEPRIRSFLERSRVEYDMFGTRVRGYRTPDAPSLWIRDYSDMMRAFRYWEPDMFSVVQHFADTQSKQGWLFDYFTMTPEKVPCEKENWAKYVRVPVEADVEYRFVKALFLAWQASGDDRWMRSLLPAAEKALRYITTDPQRWDRAHGLVKRAYTIDTWDFDYTAGRHPWLNFRITDETFWGFMHGDQSGYFEAFMLMARMYAHLRKETQANAWARFALAFRKRANAACFDAARGYYTHFVKRTPCSIPGVREVLQLSLSNPMDINRGLPDGDMARRIIAAYRRRGKRSTAFAEWFSIDPPFPDGIFGDEKIVGGAYCNGGIMPLVGGELARAAFEHGEERYAVTQLLRYEELTAGDESYLWYFPDGRHASIETSTSPDALPTDAWGSSAMYYALVEGLAGVVDTSTLFRSVILSPRWLFAGVNEADVTVRYGASDAELRYRFARDRASRSILMDIDADAEMIVRIPVPPRTSVATLTLGGRAKAWRMETVGTSAYAVTRLAASGAKSLCLIYEPVR